MSDTAVIALMLEPPLIKVGGETVKLSLPPGCIGMCLAFESAEASEKWYGKKVDLVNIERS